MEVKSKFVVIQSFKSNYFLIQKFELGITLLIEAFMQCIYLNLCLR